jgi:hypothetical protein
MRKMLTDAPLTPTNSDERHALRAIELRAATATIRELQDELAQVRTDYAYALERIDVLQATLVARTDALHLAEAAKAVEA